MHCTLILLLLVGAIVPRPSASAYVAATSCNITVPVRTRSQCESCTVSGSTQGYCADDGSLRGGSERGLDRPFGCGGEVRPIISWCTDFCGSTRCLSGNDKGPTNGTCDRWSFYQADCTCMVQFSCSSCRGCSQCQWCLDSDHCYPGDSSGGTRTRSCSRIGGRYTCNDVDAKLVAIILGSVFGGLGLIAAALIGALSRATVRRVSRDACM